jgi:hypothetical protein
LAQKQVSVDRTAIGAIKQPVRIVGQQGTRVPPEAVSRITIARDELLVARIGDQAAETVVNNRRRFELPLKIIGVAPSGEQLNLGAVVEVAGGGLRLRNDAAAFAGQIFVGIEDKDNPAGARALGRQVRFLVTANADSVTPGTLEVDHANLPFVPVQIEAVQPGPSVSVRVRPDFEPKGFDIDVGVVRPRLTLVPSPPVIQGFGLETTDLAIGVEGAVVPAGVSVRLSSDRGRLSSTVVTLGADGSAVANLRSSGLVDANVSAHHALFESKTATVTFAFPWAFAMAVALGGTVGGVLRYGVPKRRKGMQVQIRPLIWHAVFGIVAGLLVATAYAVGINLLNVQPEATTGEALVFVLSALGALASTARLVKMIAE